MSKRHRTFRKQHSGITPYMLWILCGAALHWEILHCNKKRRMYLMKSGTRECMVHASAVNTLVMKGLLKFNSDKTGFELTNIGRVPAYYRLKQSGINIEDRDVKNELGLKDSSAYVG